MKSKIVLSDQDVLVAFKQKNVDFAEFSKQASVRAKLDNNQELVPFYSLDKSTGGLVLYARSTKAKENIMTQILDGDFESVYYAVVVGVPSNEKGVYSACVARDKQTGVLEHIPALNYDAINFSFGYEVLETVDKISLVKVKSAVLDSEMLRFGLSDMGAPVFGDKEYKGDALAKNTFLALELLELHFRHPSDESERTFVVVPEGKPWSYFDLNKWFRI